MLMGSWPGDVDQAQGFAACRASKPQELLLRADEVNE
jgi:hypothetical protein